MNDFTKEELEFLKHAIREHYKNNTPIKGSTYVNIWAEMIKKIESMIDSYCEHESDGEIWEGNSDNDMPDEFRCVKCGKFYL